MKQKKCLMNLIISNRNLKAIPIEKEADEKRKMNIQAISNHDERTGQNEAHILYILK